MSVRMSRTNCTRARRRAVGRGGPLLRIFDDEGGLFDDVLDHHFRGGVGFAVVLVHGAAPGERVQRHGLAAGRVSGNKCGDGTSTFRPALGSICGEQMSDEVVMDLPEKKPGIR